MAFAELKAKQSVMWGNGPYERITRTLQDIHVLVIERPTQNPETASSTRRREPEHLPSSRRNAGPKWSGWIWRPC